MYKMPDLDKEALLPITLTPPSAANQPPLIGYYGLMARYGINKSWGTYLLIIIVIFLFFGILLFNKMLALKQLTASSIPISDVEKFFIYSQNKKLVEENLSYGIIIDAGSTGSRLFLYSWKSKSPRELIEIGVVVDSLGQPVIKKVSPGLSSFGEKPEGASEYFRPLLEYAAKNIPEEKHSSTPLFIFATAGMRLLTIEQQQNVIKNLHVNLPQLCKFQVLPQHIQVISGKWEGIYSWIAVNYILGRFKLPVGNNPNKAIENPNNLDIMIGQSLMRPKTAGMIDMGGASAQIAFELPSDIDFISENVQTINLGSNESDPKFLYKIFVTTFLGFGVNEGAKKYEQFLSKKLQPKLDENLAMGNMNNNNNNTGINNISPDSNSSKTGSLEVNYVRDGCLPSNFLKLVTHDDGNQFVRKGTGDWDTCVNDLAHILFNSPGGLPGSASICPLEKTCFFGGVEAPGAGFSLSEIELYGFSEYWFSVEDVLNMGGRYDHDLFEKGAKDFCSQPWSNIKSKARTKLYPKANDERLETQCFKSAWIHAVLHNGFHVNEFQHRFQSAFKIRGEEVQWALGAIIYHMRFFPLINAQNRDFDLKKFTTHLDNSILGKSSFNWHYLLIIFVLICLLFYSMFMRGSKFPQKNQQTYLSLPLFNLSRKKSNQIR